MNNYKFILDEHKTIYYLSADSCKEALESLIRNSPFKRSYLLDNLKDSIAYYNELWC